MGSSINPIVANMFMGQFEIEAFSSAANPSKLWRRYVDDTFVIQKNIGLYFYNTSTPFTLTYISLQSNLTLMDLYPL